MEDLAQKLKKGVASSDMLRRGARSRRTEDSWMRFVFRKKYSERKIHVVDWSVL